MEQKEWKIGDEYNKFKVKKYRTYGTDENLDHLAGIAKKGCGMMYGEVTGKEGFKDYGKCGKDGLRPACSGDENG